MDQGAALSLTYQLVDALDQYDVQQRVTSVLGHELSRVKTEKQMLVRFLRNALKDEQEKAGNYAKSEDEVRQLKQYIAELLHNFKAIYIHASRVPDNDLVRFFDETLLDMKKIMANYGMSDELETHKNSASEPAKGAYLFSSQSPGKPLHARKRNKSQRPGLRVITKFPLNTPIYDLNTSAEVRQSARSRHQSPTWNTVCEQLVASAQQARSVAAHNSKPDCVCQEDFCVCDAGQLRPPHSQTRFLETPRGEKGEKSLLGRYEHNHYPEL